MQRLKAEMIEEIREKMVSEETVAIRKQLQNEEKARMAAERFRIREKLLSVGLTFVGGMRESEMI